MEKFIVLVLLCIHNFLTLTFYVSYRRDVGDILINASVYKIFLLCFSTDLYNHLVIMWFATIWSFTLWTISLSGWLLYPRNNRKDGRSVMLSSFDISNSLIFSNTRTLKLLYTASHLYKKRLIMKKLLGWSFCSHLKPLDDFLLQETFVFDGPLWVSSVAHSSLLKPSKLTYLYRHLCIVVRCV